jgi:competence protein ComEC
VTPLANLVLVPLATGALVLGAALLAAGAVLPEVAAPCADAVAALLAAAARLFAAIPGGWLPVPPAPAWLLAVDGALLAAAAWRPSRARLHAAAAGLAALAILPHALPPRPEVPAVVVLDAGHGMAVLADAGTARVLCDAGGRGPRVGSGAILPALRARGAGALEALVLSHEDADHCGAAAEVLAALPVGLLVVGEPFGAGATGRGVLAAAAAAGVPVVRGAAGDAWSFDGLRFEVLHPPRGAAADRSDNDGSLVVRVAMDGLSVLCPGDLESPGVAALLDSGADLRADVLLLPHHGSPRVRGVEALAAATGAATLVVSAGPGTVRLDRVGAPGAPVLRSTAGEGAVVIRPRER